VTTYTAFVNGLEALVATGVTTRLASSAPLALNSADLPVQWVAAPRGGWPTLKADLIVAYEAAGQDTGPTNFVGTVTMMDNLSAALRGATTLCGGPLRWDIKVSIVTVASVNYWAVIASVEGSG
jgi:hypothetical protein